MVINWLQRHPRIVDWGLVFIALATTAHAAFQHNDYGFGVTLAILASLPLLARRQFPLSVLATTTLATVAILATWHSYNPFPAGLALFTVAERCPRRTSLAAGAISLGVLALPLWSDVGWLRPYNFLPKFVGFAVAWLIGDSVRSRRRYTQALEERAERLERERETEAARAVAEEQARIARELHDVIAHTLSVIVVQAAAARDVFSARPERALAALANIEASGRGALAELRRLLGAVRGDAMFAPQPGLERLDELLNRVRSAGLEVSFTIEGTPRPLPAALDLSAYRVVQEALTNTLKHADATRADVAVRYGTDDLGVEVRDDGSAAGNGTGTGSGLIGMRERVTVLGGSLSAGPEPGGGFAVRARLPFDEAVV